MSHKSPSVWVPGLFSRSLTKQITSGVTEQYRIKACMGLEYVKLYTVTLGFVLPVHLGSSQSISQGTKQGEGSAPASRQVKLQDWVSRGMQDIPCYSHIHGQAARAVSSWAQPFPATVCPILFAEYFAFLKEGSTQTWNNAKHSSERKGRSASDDSQLYHPTLFQILNKDSKKKPKPSLTQAVF